MTQHVTTEATATESTPAAGPTRRQVLATAGVVAAAAAATAACGSSSSANPSSPSTPAGAASSAVSEAATAAKADIPVGGGVILTGRKVVVTQPTAGTFKAFSAVCTHQGCVVASVADGTITCPCHGSTFSAADGSVQGGPAKAPLAPVNVTVSGDQITVA